ncbi:hypothetical protein CcI49_28905 [Frankia sp. CcI49]|uniref:phenylacetate--CoA ligase family protein n=1 Tax=Frankia sp. CcI49 TaxID=1745382 RepID=UPI0009757A48|nr:phenylacetate--CoA ligase family protein [Frankia sp. CcI49]ONH55529.1 hypothetical protein CcI49_28905 [Frankia sp. CcI49]
MPRDRLEALQADRVLELVPYVYERSPLYREVWDAAGVHPREIKTMDDYVERIPFISKSTIREFARRTGDPFGGLLCVDRRELNSITASSGTTGTPTLFPEVWQGTALGPLPASYLRPMWMMGLRPGDKVLVPPTTFRGRQDQPSEALGLVSLYVNSWFGQWADVLEVVRAHRPAGMGLISPNIIELDRLAEKYGLREIFSSLKAVWFAGEPLGAAMRRKLTEEWGLNLFVYTSAGDSGTAWECEAKDGYHMWEDEVLVECLDPVGGQPVEDGVLGELVSTALDNPAAPLLRYRTDDLVRVSRQRCTCGRTHVRMWVAGRRGDETIVRGRTVMPMEIWSAVEAVRETETGLFQIIRGSRETDELRLRVAYDPARMPDLSSLRERLRASVAAVAGIEPELELVTEESLLARGSAAKVPRISTS